MNAFNRGYSEKRRAARAQVTGSWLIFTFFVVKTRRYSAVRIVGIPRFVPETTVRARAIRGGGFFQKGVKRNAI